MKTKKKRNLMIFSIVLAAVTAVIAGLFIFTSWQMNKIPGMSFNDVLVYTTADNENARISIGIIKDGAAEYKVYGSNGAVLPQKIIDYEIGSLTKTFTASLLSKAIAQGKINLDDRIDQHLALPGQSHYPTLRQIATHTAGYKDWYFDWQMAANFFNGRDNDFYGVTVDSLIKKAGRIRHKDSDNAWKYSNFGISLIGQSLASAYSENYSDLMQAFIRNDLNLDNTLISDGSGNHSNYWQWQGNDAYLPAGALVSTITDMMAYCELNMTEKIPYLGNAHEKLADIDTAPSRYTKMGINMDAMALGWALDQKNDVVWHSGGTSHYNCYIGFDKSRQIGIVILSNLAPDYRIPATVMGVKLMETLQAE